MRNLVLGIVMTFIMILSISIIFTVDEKSVRDNEVSSALEAALTESLNTLDKSKYTIEDTEQLAADIVQGIVSQINSDSEITLHFLDIDKEKGIISLEVVENFKYSTNKSGVVSSVRTIILEEKVTDADASASDSKQHKVTYVLSDGQTYKTYYIKNNEPLIIPAAPGEDFRHWEYNGQKLDNSGIVIVRSDMIIMEIK